ncbi:MAG: hypothetical protein RPU90_13125 [Candidatus Sedimenticola sp. (ex Thyasira tokunagai)]
MRSLDSLWRYAHAGHPVSPRDYRGLTASAFSLPWRSAAEGNQSLKDAERIIALDEEDIIEVQNSDMKSSD